MPRKNRKVQNPKASRMPARDVMIADMNAGLTNEQMAEKYFVSVATAKSYLHKHGLRRTPLKDRPTDAQIIECLQGKMDRKAIAKELGAPQWFVNDRIRLLGMQEEAKPVAVVPTPPASPKRAPSQVVFINERGHSLVRIPTIHGSFEVRP
jgi:hypothetical protein